MKSISNTESVQINDREKNNERMDLNSLVEGQLIFAVLDSIKEDKGTFITGSEETFTLSKCDWPFSVRKPGDGGWLKTFKGKNDISEFKNIEGQDSFISSKDELKDKCVSVIYGVVAGLDIENRLAYVYYAPGRYVTVQFSPESSPYYIYGTLAFVSLHFNKQSAIRTYPLRTRMTGLINNFCEFSKLINNTDDFVFYNQKNYFPTKLDSNEW